MSAPTCGRCGVYRNLHPTSRCTKPRLSFWWDRHSLHRHILAWLWIHALTSSLRWRIAAHYNDNAKRDLCWCDVAHSLTEADQWGDVDHGTYTSRGTRHDYQGEGCLCDFPLPTDAGAPQPGWCYCAPTKVGSDD